jgi:hypothetical protein
MAEATTLAVWTTPQPFSLPELGPGVEGELQAQLEAALRRIAADPSVKALVLFGSRVSGAWSGTLPPRPTTCCQPLTTANAARNRRTGVPE